MRSGPTRSTSMSAACDPSWPRSRAHIETVRGTGYRMVESVNASRAHQRHAVRVAAVATLIVMVRYVLAALVLNLIVTNHLVGTTDARLPDRLVDARRQTLTLPGTDGAERAPRRRRRAAVPLVDRTLGRRDRADPDGSATPFPALGRRPGHAGRRVVDTSASTRCRAAWHRAGGGPEHGRDVARPVRAARRRAGLRRDPRRRRVRQGRPSSASGPRRRPKLVRRRQAEFTADASHELRTPISVIEAEVGLALDRPRDPADYREVLERVGRESTRLRRIVEDLLWLARADSESAAARRGRHRRRGRGCRELRGAFRCACRDPRGGPLRAAGGSGTLHGAGADRTSSTDWQGSSSTTRASSPAKAARSR